MSNDLVTADQARSHIWVTAALLATKKPEEYALEVFKSKANCCLPAFAVQGMSVEVLVEREGVLGGKPGWLHTLMSLELCGTDSRYLQSKGSPSAHCEEERLASPHNIYNRAEDLASSAWEVQT